MNFRLGPSCMLAVFALSALFLQLYAGYLVRRPNEELQRLPTKRLLFLANSYLISLKTVDQISDHGLSKESLEWVAGLQRSLGGGMLVMTPIVILALWFACRFSNLASVPCWSCA